MSTIPKLSIGFPVLNGESLLNNAFKSILSQTFEDFEVIVSDNGSIDRTQDICLEYVKKDKRIKYYRHNSTKNWVWNWKFVLSKAKGKNFVYHSDDDIWDSTFLEKNLKVLESNMDVVASFSKITPYGPRYDKFKNDPTDSPLKKMYKKIRRHFRDLNVSTINGKTYEERIQKCLNQRLFGFCLYSVFRTNILKKVIDTNSHPWDWTVILKILEYGNIYVIDEYLYKKFTKSVSSTTVIHLVKQKKMSLKELIFPRLPFTIWFYKNFGKKKFLKNLIFFIKLNLSGIWIIVLSSSQKILK